MRRALLAQAFYGVSLVACGPIDDEPRETQPYVTMGDSVDPATIATIYFEDTDTSIRFVDVGDGTGVGVEEYAPIDSPPLLDYLMLEQRATPLEVFLAAAPDLEPPELLLANHERMAEAGAATEVRLLDLRTVLDDSLRAVSIWFEPAMCTQIIDGGTNFDAIRQALQWTWSWYHYWNQDKTTGWYLTPYTGYTTKFRSHVCNGGKKSHPSAQINHRVYRDDSSNCAGAWLMNRWVPLGTRSVYYQTGASAACRVRTVAYREGTVKYPFLWTLGLMAP